MHTSCAVAAWNVQRRFGLVRRANPCVMLGSCTVVVHQIDEREESMKGAAIRNVDVTYYPAGARQSVCQQFNAAGTT